MEHEKIKQNLREYYDRESAQRNSHEKEEWKIARRASFRALAKSEGKRTLLEIGAGCGYDSRFFMDGGFDVAAVDLSAEMVKFCREKGIEAHEMDFYDLSGLGRTFGCVWAMNTLLHVPKPDLPGVLRQIEAVLEKGGLFFMGVYGGVDRESEFINDVCETPRFFSYYTEESLKEALGRVFDIVSFEQADIGRGAENMFQSVIMRRR